MRFVRHISQLLEVMRLSRNSGIDGLCVSVAVKAVRWFGSTKNYKSAATALAKKAGVARLTKLAKDSVKDSARSNVVNWSWNKYTKRWR